MFSPALPDRRLAPDAKPSRFRPTYRALSEEEKALHDAIKAKAAEMEALYLKVRNGRYCALALTDLESSVMWIVKGLTS
ncbi:MAG: hypothetical protein WDN08_05315 [Rhizomicrobium sp.]